MSAPLEVSVLPEHPDVVGRDTLEELVRAGRDGVCVSVFLPAHPEALGTRKDPVRLENLLQTAAEHLAAGHLRDTPIEDLLAPARALVQDGGFWRKPGRGVAVLLVADIAAVGAAGIPEAGLVTMIIVLTAAGLPLEGVGLILAVDWMLDRFRTAINVWGDAVGAAAVDRFEPRSAPA